MRVLSPANPGYVEWCRSGMPQRIRLLKLAAEKRRRIEQGVICPKCHRRRVRAGDTLCAQCRHLEDLPRCRECGRRTSRPVDGLCARCLKLVREQARPMCPKCGRCRCLEDGDMCGRCRAHRVLPSCSRCGAPQREQDGNTRCARHLPHMSPSSRHRHLPHFGHIGLACSRTSFRHRAHNPSTGRLVRLPHSRQRGRSSK